MSNRKFSVSDWNARHLERVEAYARRIELIYQAFLKEAARLAVSLTIDPDRPFSFSDFPQASAQMQRLMSDMVSQVLFTIQLGQESEWLLSNQKNDALVGSVLTQATTPVVAPARYMQRNLDALAAFQQRKTQGMNLSDRVWKYTGQFKSEIEMGLDVGLGEGRSAAQISRDLRSYLQNPDQLFRRVRDKRGNLVLSKHAQNFNPGQGVYRSSFKNAMRLTRSEINIAYHSADMERYRQLNFIVGYEVRRSNRGSLCDVCDSLKGRYPVSFIFRSWHQQCRCSSIPILATPDELRQLNRMLLKGEDTSDFKSENEVMQVNESYTNWIVDNQERLARAKTLPWFIADNLR